ncbi:hypothetical protein [Endozoicomonas atrinae]|uniref:hypothetical protein n=1 Tax=Endozoicomonas atrinae TaxID=1333660 RepID=UPI000824C861|nr:hypothetical protein [Endozoicomonas atrinae]
MNFLWESSPTFMNPNETIHNKRLLLWATGGLALIFLVYFISPDSVTYTHQATITESEIPPSRDTRPINEAVSHVSSD